MAEKVAFKNNKHFKLYDQQEHFGLLCVSGETHLLCLKIGKAYDCEESLLFPFPWRYTSYIAMLKESGNRL